VIVNEAQIDELVRKVLGRLGQAAAGGVSSTANAKQPTAECGELVLAERVVTLDTLDGKLDGIRRVVASSTAIVTPAVRDALRDRKIECVRRTVQATTTKKQQNASLVVAAIELAHAQQAAEMLGDNAAAIAASTLVETVHDVCSHVADGKARGLLLTDQPAVAVCLANRQRTIRAAHITCHQSAGEVVASIGANLLIVDSRGLSSFQLKRLVQAACKGSAKQCPAEFKNALEAAS
jgi:hypothetical protein